MSTFILVDALLFAIGGAVFAAIGWLMNRAAGTVRSPAMRLATAVVTSLLPLLLLLVLGIGPALQYGLYASQDPRLALLVVVVAPLVLPAALGSFLGAKKPGSGAPRLS